MRGIDRPLPVLALALAAWAATYARVMLNPLQEAVRVAFQLSDTQIALLQGPVIAIPLALAAIPFGLLADRISRIAMLRIALILAVISAVFSAMATNFPLLMAARALGAIAVSGILVAAYSAVSDLVSQDARGRGTAIVAIGEMFGAPAAFALGGALLAAASVADVPIVSLSGADSWRDALLLMGIPLVAVLCLMMGVREPQRRERIVDEALSSRGAWLQLWRFRSIAMPLQLARATIFIADGAVYVWAAPLLQRKYALPPEEVGGILGIVLLVSSLVGCALGGPLVDYLQKRGGARRTMQALALFALISAPAGLFALAPQVSDVAILIGIFLALGLMNATAALALTLIVLPGEVRALNFGVSVVVGSLMFVGLAPLTVSSLSEVMGGPSALPAALAIVCCSMSVVNAAVFGLSARSFSSDPASGSFERQAVPGVSG